MLPLDKLTHVIYAFFKTDPATGIVSLSDPWADTDKQQTLGGQGCLGELKLLKQKNPHIKVLLSLGGWTYSSDLTATFADPQKLTEFCRSAVVLMVKHEMDGIDIDWEYPETEEQAFQYVSVLQRMRLELDSAAMRKNLERSKYELTIAAPAGQQKSILRLREMDRYLNYWNLMTYDFSGSWSPTVDHLACLYGPGISTSNTVDFYITQGVPSTKIVMGMPLYGRSFDKTNGLGQPFSGVVAGKFEQGTHDIKDLPLPGTNEGVDHERCAAYCQGNQQYASYDNAETMAHKAQYAKSRNLGGGMWWEASGDRAEESLITSFYHNFR